MPERNEIERSETMEGTRVSGFVWPAPPVAPYEFSGESRVVAERTYPEFMDRYLSICEGLVRVFGDERVPAVGGGAGTVSAGSYGAGNGGLLSGPCTTRDGSFVACGGNVERVDVGARGDGTSDARRGSRLLSVGNARGAGVDSGCGLEHGTEVGSGDNVLGRGIQRGTGDSSPQSSYVARGLPRGPNYLRNQATRMKNRIRKEERKAQQQGFFSDCDADVQRSLRETRARLLLLENKRKAIEEERKIAKLESPMQVIEDAMKMVKFAEDAAKRAGESKVAGWAATLTESYAESIAKSAPSSVPSLASVSSGGSKRVVAAKAKAAVKQASKFTIAEMPLSKLEAKLESLSIMSITQIVEARRKAGRQLLIRDFESPTCPVRLGPLDKVEVYAAAGVDLFN